MTTEADQTHQLELPASLDSLAPLAEFVTGTGASLGFPPEVCQQLELAADEAFTNIASYAYPDRPHGPVWVTLSRLGGEAVLTMEDEGVAFELAEAPPPDLDSALMDRHVGGLGIFLMESFMDRVERSRENGRNRLVMAKVL